MKRFKQSFKYVNFHGLFNRIQQFIPLPHPHYSTNYNFLLKYHLILMRPLSENADGTYYVDNFFPKNCMKIKEFEPGGRLSSAPLDLPMQRAPQMDHFSLNFMFLGKLLQTIRLVLPRYGTNHGQSWIHHRIVNTSHEDKAEYQIFLSSKQPCQGYRRIHLIGKF